MPCKSFFFMRCAHLELQSCKELDGEPLEDGDFPMTQVDEDIPMPESDLAEAIRKQLDEFVDIISDDEPDTMACNSSDLVAYLHGL